MKIYNAPSRADWTRICRRPEIDAGNLETVVKEVFDSVAKNGDKALKDYTKRFDGVDIATTVMPLKTIENLAAQTTPSLKRSINQAYKNIKTFHQMQILNEPAVETVPGVLCWRESRPIERVGLYVPGGSAPLISTVLMLGAPAQLAGCDEIVLCTPPTSNGDIFPAICYAALKVGVTTLMRVGGIQAIAALAQGTESVDKVYKIFGPGNQYVTAAKQYAASAYEVAIDMPAGPSEIMVIADSSADPTYAAADLLSQAEHGPDSQAVLVTDSLEFAKTVQSELDSQWQDLPRKDVVAKAFKNSFCVVLSSIDSAIEFANIYGPEHLVLSVRDTKLYAPRIQNVGSVFIGDYSPVSAGDYASGTNHTLPTNGWSRMYGGVSLDSFVKKVTFQAITKNGLKNLAPSIKTLARAEGLEAHARSVSVRLKTV